MKQTLVTQVFALLLLSIFLAACQPGASPQVAQLAAPQVWIDAPLDGSNLPLKPYDIVSHATFPQGITQFELSVNGQVLRTDSAAPGQALVQVTQNWNPPAPGTYLVSVRASSPTGNFGSPALVRVTVGSQTTATAVPTRVTAPDQPTPTDVATTDAQPTQVGTTPPTAARPAMASPTSPRGVVMPSATRSAPLPPATATATRYVPPPATATRYVPPPPTWTPVPPTATRYIPPTATLTPVPRDTQGPPAPTPGAPINGLTVQCTWVNLTWRPVSDPSGIRGYDVELDRVPARGLPTNFKSWSGLTSTSVAVSPDCYISYRWRVRATDGAGNVGSWSAYATFSVGSTPIR